jgi:hypothetical protein
MEDKTLAAKADEPQSSYKVETFHYSELIRDLRVGYMDFIYANWLNSLRQGNDYFKLIDSVAYYLTYKKFLRLVLERPLTRISMASLADNPDVLLGFVVTEEQTLHYIYVPKESRHIGIARSLAGMPKSFTHLTRTGMKIWNKPAYKHLVFNPFQ